jgi:hypothetical protein
MAKLMGRSIQEHKIVLHFTKLQKKFNRTERFQNNTKEQSIQYIISSSGTNIKFWSYIKGKTRWNRIRYEIFWEEVRIQNLLIQKGRNSYNGLAPAKRMDRTRIQRKT